MTEDSLGLVTGGDSPKETPEMAYAKALVEVAKYFMYESRQTSEPFGFLTALQLAQSFMPVYVQKGLRF